MLARGRTQVRLGEVIGRGGEGEVRAILGHSDQVAKVYARAPDAKQGQKLRTMADSTDPGLLKIAAWPSDLLLGRQGLVQGFVMPRAKSAENVHELYSPKSRADAFPTADFRFLVHVGANIARAFATVHERGHIVGDVNHGNVLVGSDGTVMLIDCDSFQVRNGSNLFTCDVGSPLFTAPELHGRPFRGLVRTVNHDRFGLAVLLFYLLYMGRHPYAGRYSGSGEMSPERFIAENLFAYGANRRMFGMERPPGTISLEAMGPAIAAQFECGVRTSCQWQAPSPCHQLGQWADRTGGEPASLPCSQLAPLSRGPEFLPLVRRRVSDRRPPVRSQDLGGNRGGGPRPQSTPGGDRGCSCTRPRPSAAFRKTLESTTWNQTPELICQRCPEGSEPDRNGCRPLRVDGARSSRRGLPWHPCWNSRLHYMAHVLPTGAGRGRPCRRSC